MRNFIAFFIKFPIWSNVFKLLIILFGAFIVVFAMQSSFFPEDESRNINIELVYPGASPEELELGVIQLIEENLQGTEGIIRYQSTSRENAGSITIEVADGYDIDKALDDVKNAVDRINSFPIGPEPPVVAKRPVIETAYEIGIYGDVDLKTLKTIAQSVEDEFIAMPGISQVAISGYPPEEIVFTVSQEKLRAYGVTFDQVSVALAGANLDLTAGSIKTSEEEILIRLRNKKYYAESLTDVIVTSAKDGRKVSISELGKIENRWAEQPQRSYLDGQQAVKITVSKLLGENILDIAEQCRNFIPEFNGRYDNVQMITIRDRTVNLQDRIDLLIENGLIGTLLVAISLTLFLNWRVAFWVALSIPFSFAGMFIVAYFAGVTINVISLFGCIVVVGILVDDGIVVAEQIYQYHEAGEKPFNAAIDGTLHVLRSVFFAILTTVTAFIPIMLIDFRINIGEMAFVVIFSLVFSFFEVLFILPTHLAHSKALRDDPKKLGWIRQNIENFFNYCKNKLYAPVVKLFIDNSILAPAVYASFVIITIGALGGGLTSFKFFPPIESDQYDINIELPAGTREHITEDLLDRIESAAWAVNDSIVEARGMDEPIIEKILKNVAFTPGNRGSADGSGSNLGGLSVYMKPSEIRQINSLYFASLVKQKTGPLYNTTKAEFGVNFFGKPISLTVVGRDMDELKQAKLEIKDMLNSFNELTDIGDNDPEGIREINIDLKQKAYLLGLTSREVARQIRQGFFGQEVQRIQRGKDEVKVWLKLNDANRSSLKDFEDYRIRTVDGDYPVSELVDYNIERGSILINHIDGQREVTITASLKDPNAEIQEINSQVNSELEKILAKYSSVNTALTGTDYSQKKVADGAQTYLSIALIFMFFFIALSFHSYLQSLAVFLLIPLGVLGAVWGHIMTGNLVSILSFYGVIALIGIIVNDSIVLVNQFNLNISRGMKIKPAITEAAISRFRPIVLTTITTILGLLPLLAEKSVQAQFLVPMAVSVAFGLMFASIFILLLLPSLIYLLNHGRRSTKWLLTGKWFDGHEVEPAHLEKIQIAELMDQHNERINLTKKRIEGREEEYFASEGDSENIEIKAQNKTDDNITDDVNAPELYTKRMVFIFSILFSGVFGLILYAMNLYRLNLKKHLPSIYFSIIVYLGLVSFVNIYLEGLRIAYFALNGAVGIYINNIGWQSQIGKNLKYRKRPILIPILIGLVISAIIFYLMTLENFG